MSVVSWNENDPDTDETIHRSVSYTSPRTAEQVAAALPDTAHVENIQVHHDCE